MNIPPPLNTLVAAIDAAHQANQEPPRPHLGASVIGHKCQRWIWLSFRWAVIEKFPGRILRLFRRGHREESIVYEDLRLAGCKVQTVDAETRKQYRFSDGHFAGSCDGIVTGLPEAPKTPHLLEIKTHSLKSFNEVKAKGVLLSKPQHYAQMQVYMAAFKLDDALYYAVCKDNDEIYTERVKASEHDQKTFMDRAQRIIEADRIPQPISTDPSWFECKWCAGHDLCHGSKLTKQANCRTCLHSTAERDGTWTCAHWGMDIPDAEAQRAGCDNHILHPDLVPWQFEHKQTGVIWLTPNGDILNAPGGHTSAEIVANWQACASNVKLPYAAFDAKVVG